MTGKQVKICKPAREIYPKIDANTVKLETYIDI